MSKEINDISIFAPDDEIIINCNYGTSEIENGKNWKEFKNGELLNEYNGNTLPGCSDFNKYRDEDKNKIFNNNSWELWENHYFLFRILYSFLFGKAKRENCY